MNVILFASLSFPGAFWKVDDDFFIYSFVGAALDNDDYDRELVAPLDSLNLEDLFSSSFYAKCLLAWDST